ncbi:MAG TPA: transglutaminase-like domain-containing protein [Burkholderiales bacterium]|nr:transglutaminase-like domain-containing protein [Burkholderiales bacterium]
MTAPPFLIGAALAFWGWQSGHAVVGIGLGVALEATRYLKLRLELGAEEHSRIADLSTIGFVTLVVLLAANRGISRGILDGFIWSPAALAPVMLAQMLSTSGRIPLSALFRYMRKLRRRNPEVKDPLVDVSPVYVALTVIAAGVANVRGPAYYAGVVIATGWALYAVRPRHSAPAAWMLILAVAAGAGYAGQLGIADLQARIESWVVDFNLRGLDADPYRSITEIGSIGRLKQYDAILLRVYAAERDAPRIRLLHRASYNTYAGTSWFAREAQMQVLDSDADGTTWALAAPAAAQAPAWRVRIAARIDRGKALLPLPAETTRIAGLTAVALRKNALGAVHADVGTEWIQYEPEGGAGIASYSPPTAVDSIVPAVERGVFDQVAAELRLRDVPAEEAVRRIEQHLGSFAYSLYREHPVPKGETALGDFMTRTRSGHCEYFAAAATLLLRAAGIPARYATGYAVMERSALEDAYVVRSRHAHAWTRAWVGGRWIDLDPTPPDWFGLEADEAPFWQGLADLARWAGFRWAMRGDFEAGEAWYGVLVVLALILGWRMFGGKRVARQGGADAAAARRRYPGEDSEFYAVEKALPARDAGETQAEWVKRIASRFPPQELNQLKAALLLHQRYRFDPQGLAATERNALRELCRSLTPRTQ